MNDKGLVVLTADNDIISKIIRWFRRSKYSHLLITFGKIANVLVAGEATFPRSRVIPLHKYVNKNTRLEIWQLFSLNSEKIDKSITSLMLNIGGNYGVLQLIGFIWIWFWWKIGVRKQNPFHDGEVCSEWGWVFLKNAGYNKLPEMDQNDVAPDTIRKIFMRDNHAKIVGYSDFGEDKITWINK